VLLYLSSPGTLDRDGWLVLAWLGLYRLGSVLLDPLAEPGAPRIRVRRALLAEYLGHVLGAGLWFHWLAHVHPATLLYVAPAYALYFLAQGPVLRRMASRLPVALALGLTLWGFEALRSWIPLPFGLGWFRMAHHAHHHLWLSGSVRVLGIEGLSLAVALAAGSLLGCLRARRLVLPELALGLGGIGVCAILSLGTAAPPMKEAKDWPRLLLVQPGFADERLGLQPARQRLLGLLELSHRALESLREAGEPPPDVVCWGESMLHVPVVDAAWRAAVAEGERPPGWPEGDLLALAESYDEGLQGAVLGPLFSGPRPILDPGSWFVGGSEHWTHEPGEGLRREVMLALFDPRGELRGIAGKRFLCPGAETLHGLEHLAPVRGFFRWIGGYVPDFSPAERTTVFELTSRSGEPLRLSATLCFDNAFQEPYLDAVGQGALDLHLVASNEAWFKTSYEMDHMVAFSRLLALSTGRSLVRATNSGVSIGIGPDGRELGRVGGAGQDRAVSGWRLIAVPVPLDGSLYPPFPALAGALRLLSIGIPLLVLLFVRRAR